MVRYSNLVATLAAIIGIVAVEMVALFRGIDGVILSGSIGVIAVLGGAKLGQFLERKK